MTRSRTRRGQKPCSPCGDAARFHVSFHDKHSRRRPRILFICPADGRLRLETRQRRGRRGGVGVYLQPPPKKKKKHPKIRRVTCVIFSSLPSSSGSLALAASNRAETTPNSLRSACLLGFGFRPDPVTPADVSFLFVMAVPCCVFILKKRGGLRRLFPLPLAFVAQNVLSALHITGEPSKNCAPARRKNTYIPRRAPCNPPREMK